MAKRPEEELDEELLDDEILDDENLDEVEDLEDVEIVEDEPKKKKEKKIAKKGKLSKGAILGISIGSGVVGLTAIVLVVILVLVPLFGAGALKSDCVNEKITYSTSYKDIKLSTGDSNWRDGMVGGNGRIGFITNSSPTSDVITYQDIDFIMPTSVNRDDIPTSSTSLDELRQKIVNHQAPASSDVIDSWDRIGKYHPGMQLRVDTKYSSEISKYQRYTNYETAEVGETYNDGNTKWERKTFSSREDDVTITSITNSDNKVSIDLSIDTISKMSGFGLKDDNSQVDEKNMRYKEIAASDGSYLMQVAHYPNYANSSLKNGGFATVSYIVVDGGTKTATNTTNDDTYSANKKDAAISIKDAKAVYIITALDRTNNLGDMDDFAGASSYNLTNTLLAKVQSVAEKYGNTAFSYEKALEPSAKIQNELFNSTSLTIVDKNDAELGASNNKVIKAQKESKELSTVLSNRAYNQGRYAMICCAGHSMTKLSGMWIGTWDPGWRYIYTMDANVNLQSSGMNTSNLSTFGDGYISFVYNQIEDWKKNAKAIYGVDEAILCPPHCDGDRAINDEGNIGYPFQYWNAGAAWMIQPIYEYYQCYGNKKINTWSGEKDLLDDILYPLLTLNANFWMGICTPKYYTDAQGNARYSASKTSLSNDEKYLIVPSYSPENDTKGTYKSTLAANAAMDISAAKYSLQQLISLENKMQKSGYSSRVSEYETFMNLLPNYQYDESGAVKEWCANGYNDNNAHRHLSHLYLAWPAFETQDNQELLQATKQALANRDKSATLEQSKQSHCWLHKGLIAARIKDADYVTNCLYTMFSAKNTIVTKYGSDGLFYNSMMTNHDITGTSNAYCTDSSLGLIGIMNEALLYSNDGVIELLPACPTTWTKGKFENFRARTQATVTCKWENGKIKYAIKSDINQEITVKYQGKSTTVKVKAGQTKRGSF